MLLKSSCGSPCPRNKTGSFSSDSSPLHPLPTTHSCSQAACSQAQLQPRKPCGSALESRFSPEALELDLSLTSPFELMNWLHTWLWLLFLSCPNVSDKPRGWPNGIPILTFIPPHAVSYSGSQVASLGLIISAATHRSRRATRVNE